MLVLTGLHTSGGMMREAYPINHFLLVAIYSLAVFAIGGRGAAFSRTRPPASFS